MKKITRILSLSILTSFGFYCVSCNWNFGTNAYKDLIRHDDPDLNINYTATDTQLILTFIYAGDGFAGSRASQISRNGCLRLPGLSET